MWSAGRGGGADAARGRELGGVGGGGGGGGEGDLGGVRVGLGHRFAAAWMRVRAAFGDGSCVYLRDDPDGMSAV
jgi:hypothetical protein